jgi:hypothetical protein
MKKKTKKTQHASKFYDNLLTVAEMSAQVDGQGSDFPIAAGIDLQKLTDGDDEPMFVIVRVLEETVSANGNHWTEAVIKSVARQIMDKTPDGYLGHLSDEDRATVFPDPQTLWVGAKIETDPSSGKLTLIAKGYVLPDSKIRTYLKKATAANKQVSVSVYGRANRVFNKYKKCYDIKAFDLESIDWARPGSQGVANANLLSITQETMKRQEVIATATLDELQEFNPDIVQEIREEAKEEAKSEVVSEMKGEAKATQKALKEITDELGDKPLEAVAEMRNEFEAVSGRLANKAIDAELDKRVSNDTARRLIQKMVVSEMANVNLTEDETSEAENKGVTVSEMRALKAVDSVLETEDAKQLIKEMMDKKPFSPEKPKDSPDGRTFTVKK